MRKYLLLLVLVICYLNFPIRAQEWVKTFTNGNYAYPQWVIQTYDKGYLILINSTDNNSMSIYLWLIKTDINGNKLWEKSIGSGIDHINFGNIEESPDHGYILAGAFSKYGGLYDDPAIIKLNSCGELDWCGVIKTPEVTYDYATRAKQTTQGDYILLTLYSNPDADSCIQLFKLNGNGNLKWKHSYFPDSLIWEPQCYDVRVDDDGYLISASCYYPDPGNPNIGYERPYYIKTDTAGNLKWWLVYGSGNGFHGFTGDATIKSPTGNFYSIGWHSNYCDTPVLVKCTGIGQESYYQDLIPGVCPGGVSGVNWVNDSTFIICAGGTLNGNTTTRWMKTDTFGIMNYYKEVPAWMGQTSHTVKSFDDKFISVARVNSIYTYLYKLNANLDYDSVYSRPFTYDSLCPGGVVSDTINPDCDLIVHIDDQEREPGSCQMKVFPNPASGRVTVELPDCLKQTTKQPGITSTSVTYQWRSTSLEVYDLNGRRVFSQEIPKSQQTLEVDVSGWRPGIYYFRLVFNERTVSGGKVVVR